MTRYPALGFDPAPGDPAELAQLGRETGRVAGEVDDLARQLRRLGELGGDWRGTAADVFATALDELPQQLQVAQESFGAVAGRLSEWAGELADLQSQARAAEADAAEALARLRAARAAAGAPRPTTSGPAALADHLQDLQAAAGAIESAERALAAARARGERVQERARDGSARVERAVRDAARVAPDSGLLKRVGGSLVDAVRSMNDGLATFVRDHKQMIADLTDALSAVALVAAFTSLGPLGLLAMGLLTLAGTGALAAYTDERDAGDVALAAVGVGLTGAASAAGRAARLARVAETGAPVARLPSMFTPGLTMGNREFAWRTVQLQPTLAGHAVGLVSNVETARARGILPPRGGRVRAGGERR